MAEPGGESGSRTAEDGAGARSGEGAVSEESAGRAAGIVGGLLAWYEPRDRDVPGRGESDPYRVWVAEVMAQQTRLSTVADYYGPFLERFPDVASLAEADQHEVLKAWEGLGYYARARRLHRAAREVMEEYGGRLPADAGRLRELPGVGPYTAGAVASMAFGEPEPAVDGNVRRVLCRLFDLEDPGRGELEARAGSLLRAASGADPADVNQALMDLGAEVCTPRSPSCDTCPVEEHCLARARGTVAERPPERSRRDLPHHDIAVGTVWDREGRVLVARRPPEGLLGGLWEFPGGKIEDGETPEAALRRELREEMEIEVEVLGLLGRVEHAYSHFRITLHAHHARHVRGEPTPRAATDWAWARPGELDGLAFPAANVRLLDRIREQGPPAGAAGG